MIGGVWAPVSVVDIWAKSRDGKSVRHYIFTEKSDVGDYLYESEEEVTEFGRIFRPVFYDFGANGMIHSIKGFGVMNYYYATSINRTKCKALDAVGLTMGLNFTKDDDTPDETPPVQAMSFINVLPKGLTQVPVYPQLQPAMEMMKLLSENQNENNYTYDDSGTQQNIAQTDTKGQAELIASISSEGQSSQAAIYLSQEGRVFGEIVRRLCQKSDDPDAKKFKARCKELGVPDAVFETKTVDGKEVDVIRKTVRCGASPTMASPAIRGKIANELLGMSNMPGMNVRAIQELKVSNLTGSEGVSTYMLPIGVNSDPRARREAIMENEDMSHGIVLGDQQSYGVDPSDDHVAHADEHLKPLEAIVQQAQQSQQQNVLPGQPMTAPAQITPDHLMALQGIIPHAAVHIKYLEGDETKRPQFKELNARLSAVVNVAKGIISRLARAQANGQTPDANGQAPGLDAGAVQTALAGPRQ